MTKRGRPSFKATAEQRKKVRKLSKDGHSILDVARLMKLSAPTLRRYFAAELISDKKKKTPPPEFKITAALRERFIRLHGAGMPLEEIALVLRCTAAQVRDHFADEIPVAKATLRAKVIDDLNEQSGDGKTSASNQLLALTAPTEGQQSAPAIVGGKKAAAAAEAQRAASGGKFAPPAAPKLVVNNE